ncbi:MAG TPA: sugar transferase [Bdellovibrio sp.]|nr:sugar transferase [Bdellovibrio sp.]
MWLGKRAFDFFASLVGLIFLAPVFFIVAIWIKVDSNGPIFFRQVRIGLNEVPFRIHKFRTMFVDAEKKGLQITMGRDPRITRAGFFLRKYKLDELPQLIDVWMGTMSFVGPRPEVPRYVEYYPAEIKKKIFSVKPGITDKASIEFKDENSILGKSATPEQDYITKILPVKWSYHLEYAKTASFRGDLKIICQTFKEIFLNR